MRRALPAALALFALSAISAARASAQARASGRFLEIDPAPRQAAMGGAAVALADDVSAVHYNPAGLRQLLRSEAGFAHHRYVGGVSYDWAAFGRPTAKRGAWAADLGYVRYGQIKGYTENDTPTGDVGASDMKLTGAWAGEPLADFPGLKAGGALKLVRSTLDSYNASAYAADFGALYPALRAPGYTVTVGGSLRNLGTKLKYASEKADLPRAAVVGVGFRGLQESLSVAFDVEAPQHGSIAPKFGAEWWTRDLLALRIGWKGGYDMGPGISAGIGLRFRAAQFDFSVVPAGALGYVTRAGVLLRFGGVMGDLYAKGVSYMNQRRYADAIEVFTRVLTADPNNRDAVLRLRECQQALERQMRSP